MAGQSKLTPLARKQLELHLEVARHDMAVGLLPLFRVLPRACRHRREVVLDQEFAGSTIRIRAVEMSTFEQGVFFALLSLALHMENADVVPPDRSLIPTPPGSLAEIDLGTIQGGNEAQGADTFTLRTSMAELARTLGLGRKLGSHTRGAIDAALARLAMATLFVRSTDGRWALTHLISGARGLGRTSVQVQINARAARVVLGERSYAAISMRDWRALSSDVAKSLYGWLQAWFGGSKSSQQRRIRLEKLVEHVYGSTARSTSAQSMRMRTCRTALSDLTKLGWRVSIVGDMVSIARSTPHIEPMYAER